LKKLSKKSDLERDGGSSVTDVDGESSSFGQDSSWSESMRSGEREESVVALVASKEERGEVRSTAFFERRL